MTRTQSWRLHKLALSLAVLVCASSSSDASTCSERTVSARGESSRYEALAKAKARGNWRAQVRALPGLGPLYATWSIAEAARYECSERGGRFTCTAVARPCRR
jgi:hypothetical protein